jgi:hypothetical protein
MGFGEKGPSSLLEVGLHHPDHLSIPRETWVKQERKTRRLSEVAVSFSLGEK